MLLRCDYCPAEIEWARMDVTRRLMPLDPGVNENGNVAARVVSGRLRARYLRKGEVTRLGEERRMPHWATCPGSDEARKTRRRGAA